MGASPRAVDWDEDGDFDIISGEYNGMVTLFRNVGTPTAPSLTDAGNLVSKGTAIDVGALSVPEINDWDEDGRKDLIVGCDAGYVYVFLNTGTNQAPVFRGSTQLAADGSIIKKIKNCPRIADLNGDGLKDLILSWITGSCLYWPNRGTNAAPLFDTSHELTGYRDLLDPDPSGYNWCHMGVCDWDEDGHADLLYTRWESDIGVHLSGAHHLECVIEALSPPVVIPPQGGTIDYKVTLTNNSAEEVILDAWTDFTMPDGGVQGPVRTVAMNLSLLPAETKTFTFSDPVPAAFAPSADYALSLYMGRLDNGWFVHDALPFIKGDLLAADAAQLPEAGGTVKLYLFAGAANALRNYLVFGGVSGTGPGTPLPGGQATLPVNWDLFTNVVIGLANSPLFADFMGTLDGTGDATATLTLPPVPGMAGAVMVYAYALNKPWDFVSNPVTVKIVP